ALLAGGAGEVGDVEIPDGDVPVEEQHLVASRGAGPRLGDDDGLEAGGGGARFDEPIEEGLLDGGDDAGGHHATAGGRSSSARSSRTARGTAHAATGDGSVLAFTASSQS